MDMVAIKDANGIRRKNVDKNDRNLKNFNKNSKKYSNRGLFCCDYDTSLRLQWRLITVYSLRLLYVVATATISSVSAKRGNDGAPERAEYGNASARHAPMARRQAPTLGSGGIASVGLVFDAARTDVAAQFLTRINERLERERVIKYYKYKIETSSTVGCGLGVEDGDGAFAASQLYYHRNVSAFFGPACGSDIELVSRMIWTWSSLQFNFYRDFYLNTDTKAAPFVQISTTSAVNFAMNLIAVLTVLGWQKIAFITCSGCFSDSKNDAFSGNTIAMRFEMIHNVLTDRGITILERVDVEHAGHTPQQIAAQLRVVRSKARILVSIFGDTLAAYGPYLAALELAELDRDDFMTLLTVGAYTPAVDATQLATQWHAAGFHRHNNNENDNKNNEVSNEEATSHFRQPILIFNDFYDATKLHAFINEMEIAHMGKDDQMAYAQLFESYWLYVHCVEHAFSVTSDPQIHRNNSYIRLLMSTHQIEGPFGAIILDGTQRLAPYRVLKASDAVGEDGALAEIVRVVTAVDAECAIDDGGCATLTGKINVDFEQYLDTLPPDTPQCGFVGELCDQRGTIIVVAVIMMTICAGFVIFLCFRRVKTGETSQMPWAIPSHLISFINLNFSQTQNSVSPILLVQYFEKKEENTVTFERCNANTKSFMINVLRLISRLFSDETLNMSIHSIQQQMEKMKSNTEMKNLLRSRQLATIEQGFVIVEPFKLKEKLNFDKRDMQLLFQMKQAVHDNINPFIGVCIDKANELYLIWRHCFRGTLTDLLFASKDSNQPGDRPTVVDNNFKGAFVRDIIKGIDFLHSSSIGYHGGLTASQCLVDSHWILKISGFGISRLLYKWRHNGILNANPGVPLIPNSELHYYAPEMRRAIRHAVQRNRPEDLQFSNEDGQAQDMYSFGVILFEIIYRQKIVELSDEIEANEVVLEDETCIGIFSQAAETKLPLYPTFPKDEIHPELFKLMNRCFSGQVSQRPDANMVRKITDATLKMPGSLVDQMIKNMEQYTNNLENLVREQTRNLEEEQQHAEQILLELLPKSVVDELRLGRRVEPAFYKSATIMYSDIVGFTSLCSESKPMEVVSLLNGMFKAFDHAISQHKAYKVETIGDAYMVAAGVPEKMRTDHVREIASIALMQREFLNVYEIPHRPGNYLHCRWGFNSGSVFTGVVGITAPRYCVFGSTVTLAARMENSGKPDKIQMTFDSYRILSERFPEFHCEKRDPSPTLEGIGVLLTYWLEGREELIKIENDDGVTNVDPLTLRCGGIPPPSPPDLSASHYAPVGMRHSISPSLNSGADERAISNLSAFQNGRL